MLYEIVQFWGGAWKDQCHWFDGDGVEDCSMQWVEHVRSHRIIWCSLHITLYDYVSNDEVLQRKPVSSRPHPLYVNKGFGHVVRLPDDVPANQILWTCYEAQDGVRLEVCLRSTSHYLDSSDPPGHGNTDDWCSRAGSWQIILATNHNSVMLRLNASRHRWMKERLCLLYGLDDNCQTVSRLCEMYKALAWLLLTNLVYGAL